MAEMLNALSGLPKALLDKLIQQRFAYRSMFGMERMEYAWTVIRTRKLPLVAPGDLAQTGQVQDAANFLKRAGVSSTVTQSKIQLMVFTESLVTNRTLFDELRQKAEEILKSQGDAFKLDVVVHPNDVPYGEQIYLGPQFQEIIDIAKKATSIPADRLPVLLVKVRQNIDIHGIAGEADGRRVVAINTDEPNPDRATLLHEIGHCAGLPHSNQNAPGKPSPLDVGNDFNVMAERKPNVARKFLNVVQGEVLAKAYFVK
ncbi:MAG TPA: hypothetical protein DIC59_11150 [Candidatus Competibacteraceae bacterium]|nr:hypothetical protein [Candidatus Competibacteraceae bacterium]